MSAALGSFLCVADDFETSSSTDTGLDNGLETGAATWTGSVTDSIVVFGAYYKIIIKLLNFWIKYVWQRVQIMRELRAIKILNGCMEN